jgi:hypothetical protein
VKAGLSEENLSTIDFSSFDLRAEQLTYFERGSKRVVLLDLETTRQYVRFTKACARAGAPSDADRPVFPDLAHLRGVALKAPPRLRATPLPPVSSLGGVLNAGVLDTLKIGAGTLSNKEPALPGSALKRVDLADSSAALLSAPELSARVVGNEPVASKQEIAVPGASLREDEPDVHAQDSARGKVSTMGLAIEEEVEPLAGSFPLEATLPEREEVPLEDLEQVVSAASRIKMTQLTPLTFSFVDRIGHFSAGLDEVRTRFADTYSAKSKTKAVATELQGRAKCLADMFGTIAVWWEHSSSECVLSNPEGNEQLLASWQRARNAMRLSIGTFHAARIPKLVDRLSSPVTVSEATRIERFLAAVEQELFSLSSYLLKSARGSSGNL